MRTDQQIMKLANSPSFQSLHEMDPSKAQFIAQYKFHFFVEDQEKLNLKNTHQTFYTPTSIPAHAYICAVVYICRLVKANP